MIFRVSHDKYGEVDVEAQSRLQAAFRAAKLWKIDWQYLVRTGHVVWCGPIPEAKTTQGGGSYVQ